MSLKMNLKMKNLKMSASLIIIFAFSVSLFSCSRSDFEGEIPSFSLKPMKNSSIKSISSSGTSSKTTVNSLSEVKSLSSGDCTEELNYWNNSPQLVDNGLDDLLGIDYVISFYAKANFYDCSSRRQALEIGPEKTLREGLSVFVAESIGSVPEDSTHFVSWSENSDKSEIRGRLVNLYLHDDQSRNKIRVDMSYSNGVRTVDGLLQYSKGTFKMYTRAFFKEISNSEGEIIEHIIGGRHYNSTDEVIINVIASVRKEVGSSIFVVKCESPSSFNAPCPFSSPEAHYYNGEGVAIDQAAAEALGLETNPSSLPEELILNSFYDDDESEYFDPSF